MSVNRYNPETGNLERIAGGTVYADAPIGAIVSYGGTEAPRGWLLCDGQAVSRTTYSELFAKIGTAYGAGDGSTTFNVPDLREAVPVGAGENATHTIAAHDVYNVGEFKDDQLQTHIHTNGYKPGYAGSGSGGVPSSSKGTSNTTNPIDARTGTTTHGKQLGVNYIIKSENILVPHDFAEYVAEELNKVTIDAGTITRNPDNTEGIWEIFAAKTGRTAQIHAYVHNCNLVANQMTTIATVSSNLKPLNQMWQILINFDPIPDGLRGWLDANGNIIVLSPVTGTYGVRFDSTYITAE